MRLEVDSRNFNFLVVSFQIELSNELYVCIIFESLSFTNKINSIRFDTGVFVVVKASYYGVSLNVYLLNVLIVLKNMICFWRNGTKDVK